MQPLTRSASDSAPPRAASDTCPTPRPAPGRRAGAAVDVAVLAGEVVAGEAHRQDRRSLGPDQRIGLRDQPSPVVSGSNTSVTSSTVPLPPIAGEGGAEKRRLSRCRTPPACRALHSSWRFDETRRRLGGEHRHQAPSRRVLIAGCARAGARDPGAAGARHAAASTCSACRRTCTSPDRIPRQVDAASRRGRGTTPDLRRLCRLRHQRIARRRCAALKVEMVAGPHCYSFFDGNAVFAARAPR